jgi:hypothetical protein
LELNFNLDFNSIGIKFQCDSIQLQFKLNFKLIKIKLNVNLISIPFTTLGGPGMVVRNLLCHVVRTLLCQVAVCLPFFAPGTPNHKTPSGPEHVGLGSVRFALFQRESHCLAGHKLSQGNPDSGGEVSNPFVPFSSGGQLFERCLSSFTDHRTKRQHRFSGKSGADPGCFPVTFREQNPQNRAKRINPRTWGAATRQAFATSF